MALIAETEKRWWWLWTPKLKNATLNVKLKTNDGFKRWNWEYDSELQTKKWWLWTPKLRSDDDDSEPRNRKMRLWTSNWKIDDGSECRNWECDFECQTKKWWIWTPKLRSGDGFECWNWEAMMMTLNLETEKCDSECQTENRWWLWTPKLRMWLWTSN